MNILFISGSANTGKTETIYDLTKYLLSQAYNIKTTGIGEFLAPKQADIYKVTDFQCILEKKISNRITKNVLINSATDDKECIDNFICFYKNNAYIDTVITSIRGDETYDIDPERKYLISRIEELHKELGIEANIIEIPLGKITRRPKEKGLQWYKETTNKLIEFILKNPPFEL